MFKFKNIFFLVVVSAAIFSGCSTKKNTWLNRNFHNLTSYYNIYWNGMETYKALLIQIEGLGYDNYSSVLNVFEYGSILDTAVTIDKTLRMIEKGTKAVAKHSMLIRGVEHVKTMEKAYMLMAKGHFYQHNYSTARTVLNFVTSQFPRSPIRYEALLWMARTYIQEKEFEMASSLILQVRNNEHALYRQTWRELPAVTADFFISQKRYEEAIPFLKEAISRSRSRDFRNRLHFILAQIYQEKGDCEEAFKSYRFVTRNNATLELDYNARINMALCYDVSYANRDNLIRELKKLLQDTKNERFFGRIYYVLAEIALQDNDRVAGIEYLEKSVEFSGTDRDQLALSATRLADLFFEVNDYHTAQRYYRNAVSVMTSDHPDFDRVNTRARNLTELVRFLEIVLYEEQMQFLASLPERQRDEEIDRLIAEYNQKLIDNVERTPRALQSSQQSQQSSWYFYNEQAKSFGANEFVRRWGRRENEDFWFLQQKPAIAVGRTAEPERQDRQEDDEMRALGDYTPADREFYLVNMPLKASSKERSNRRLEENLFHLGAGYFDLVEEPTLGIKTLENLLERFPNTGYKLQAYYYLYRMNLILSNTTGMQRYRDLLVREFPNSDQTRQITDPNYFNIARENTIRAERLYQYTFEAYQNGFYDAVLENVKDAERRYPGNAFMPKFRYLEIMATGARVGVDATVESLELFVRNYPHEGDLTELARSTIEFLQESHTFHLASSDETRPQITRQREEQREPAEPEIDISMFTLDLGAPHYCLIFVEVPEVNTDFIRMRLSDFHRRNFPQDDLRTTANSWNEDQYLIYVYILRTASIAVGYFDELRNSRYVWGTTPREFYQIMLISAENFATFMKLRNKEAYQLFFETHYNL